MEGPPAGGHALKLKTLDRVDGARWPATTTTGMNLRLVAILRFTLSLILDYEFVRILIFV